MASPEETVKTGLDEARWYTLFKRKTELEIKRIFNEFHTRGLDPVLIKGWAAARNYPEGRHRYFGDIDLAVSSVDFDRSPSAAELKRITTTAVDLHRELRHLDLTPWNDLFARSQTVEIDGTAVRVLRAEDHLRVLIAHWLTDGGQYKDKLWDIYYAIENRPSDFDWNLCLESVSAVRRNWATTGIAIACKYLGLDISKTPVADATNLLPEWVDRCLEKEWATELRLRPLHTCVNDPKMFLQQIRKRIPPNPIQATVETESFFDNRWRLPLQMKSVAIRLGPSIPRVWRRLTR